VSDAIARRRAFRLGLGGERRAAWLLRLKGYRVLAARYRTDIGEADLVARRGSTLVFVEVKVRASLDAALEAITARQQRRIAAAARTWLARHPADMSATLRFDAVLVAPGRWPRHLVNAFEEDV
jgi:putative endonuclease